MALDIKPIIYAEEYHEDKPSIFRESENLDRLLQAIFDVCYQQQLDFLWLSQNLLNVDVAEKSHLDFIGNIVGQPRFLSDFNTEPYFGFDGSYQSKPFSSVTNPDIGGFWNSRSHFNTATARQLNDDEYRRLIKARAIYNQSNCTANDLLEVVNLITDSDDNTVQLLKHGLIQIKTSDTTGILSYFVDRLYLQDNILPIAAGVRVGLEEVGESDVLPDTDWIVKKVYEGSTGSKVGIDAVRTKNNLEVESSIEVTPTVGQISDRIKSGEFGAEVNKAVLDIDPEATGWILDLANNSVKYEDETFNPETSLPLIYYEPQYKKYGSTPFSASAYYASKINERDWVYDGNDCPSVLVRGDTCVARYVASGGGKASVPIMVSNNPNYDPDAPINDPTKITGYKWSGGYNAAPSLGEIYTDLNRMAQDACAQQKTPRTLTSIDEASNRFRCGSLALSFSEVTNPNYDPNAEQEQKTIPLEIVAQQVISNAEDGHAESKNLLVSIVSVLASMKLYDPLF